MISEFKHCKIHWDEYDINDFEVDGNGRVYKYVNEIKEYVSMTISDFVRCHNHFIHINIIVVDQQYRNKGFGTKAMKKFIRKHKEYPILLEAGFVFEDDYVLALYDKEYFSTFLVRLVLFYKRLGFKDVNNIYGHNCESIAMMYTHQNKRLISLIRKRK